MAPTFHASPENQTQENVKHTESQVAVVMVPLPAQGHLNQLLHLSRLVSAANITVYYVGGATHVRQAKVRVHGWDPSAIASMQFHEFPAPPPDPNASKKFGSEIVGSVFGSTHLREPVYRFVSELSSQFRRVIVVYDSLMGYVVQDIGSVSNAECYCFRSVSAFTIFSIHWENMGKPDLPTEAEILKVIPSLDGCFFPEFLEFIRLQESFRSISSGNIYNTSRAIEGLFLDLLRGKHQATAAQKQWAVGPFNPVVIADQKKDSRTRHRCLEWLDKQGPNSVIFVSFGTTSSLSDEQVKELAMGLERSQQKFIWVLRDADKGDIFSGEVREAELPEGFEEKERGIIIRDWAPQLEILAHPSTGGFMSHCGWNSCMESISMGVPIATWPMHSDQPRNAVLITKVLKIGLEMKDWDRRNEVVSSSRVENTVRKLMASEEGDEIRKRAEAVGVAVRDSVMEGGNSHKDMDSFITHITR